MATRDHALLVFEPLGGLRGVRRRAAIFFFVLVFLVFVFLQVTRYHLKEANNLICKKELGGLVEILMMRKKK